MKNVIFIFWLLWVSYSSHAVEPAMKYEANVSLVSLIATPERFDGKMIRVSGVGLFGFETSLLCLNMEVVKHNLLENCLQLGAPTSTMKLSAEEIISDYNRVYISVIGIFNEHEIVPRYQSYVDENGIERELEYTGLQVSSIDEISRIDKVPVIKYD